ncbi:Crp/Fnr family transcriptional regulator [Bdellovibrio bacteriovorus]|uniref:Crp/Fnr family transcriptional regulator n=1 Tax=Bdellovibrio bacteriovorus TaxID=959 RepID=UPI0006884E9E|nr:Crp/Fnr family transcriptional regulator [Bdellovibrio bacteriovorus]
MAIPLFKRLSQLADIPPEEWDYFCHLTKDKVLKKKELLFRQDEPSDIVAYVKKGLLVSYYNDHNNEPKVKKFSWENRITSPYTTLPKGSTLCSFSVEALEETSITFIQYKDIAELYQRHICWNILGRCLVEQALIEKEQREYDMLCLPLMQRYENFNHTYSEIINRIPQYLIASYLGVNAVSLSRLRAQRRQKKLQDIHRETVSP